MRAALYCRLSEEDRDKSGFDESLSIQNQKSMLLQYAQNEGWEVTDVYSDEDYSGADRSRPEFLRMIRDCEDGKIDIVLCKTQSRFSRELEITEKYLHTLFPAWGVRFVSIVDLADTQKKENKKARQINGLINEWYLEDLSENIKSVLTSRRKAGLHIGAFAPYGYEKDPSKKGHLVPDPVSSDIVKEIFALYCGGHGKSTIARILNQKGLPCPSQYKKLCGQKYSGRVKDPLWRYTTVSEILKNEVYIGNLVQGKYESISYKNSKTKSVPKENWIVCQNTHEPIIDIETWERAQLLQSQKSKPCKKGVKSAFSGLVKCSLCGCVMRKTNSRGNVYFRCSLHYISKDGCIGAFISENLLYETVTEKIIALFNSFPFVQISKKLFTENQSTEKTARLLKKKEYALITLKKLYEDRAKGILTDNEFYFLLDLCRQEISTLDLMLCKNESKCTKNVFSFDECKSIITHALYSKSSIYAVLRSFIDSINVGRREKGTDIIPLEIKWHF